MATQLPACRVAAAGPAYRAQLLPTQPAEHPSYVLAITLIHHGCLKPQRPGRYLQEAEIFLEQRRKSSHSTIMSAEALQSYCGLLSASQLLKNDAVRLILKHCVL